MVNTPQYANGVGLLKYGIRMNRYKKPRFEKGKVSLAGRIRKWMQDYL